LFFRGRVWDIVGHYSRCCVQQAKTFTIFHTEDEGSFFPDILNLGDVMTHQAVTSSS
jgi:hypothetical protein